MRFFAFGLNHETAPVSVREAFAFSEAAQQHFYRTVHAASSAEVLLLSTCNRTEVYLFGSEADMTLVRAHLCRSVDGGWDPGHTFLYQDERAVRHLLQVTCGLRSMVLGDAQILAQVKDAYRLAVEEDTVSTVMHRLLHTAFRAAKRVVSETSLTSGAFSVPSAAVALAEAHFLQHAGTGLAGRRALLIGTGHMGQLALDLLKTSELSTVSVTNRSTASAEAVAAAVGACVVPWAERYDALRRADVVIVATGAAEPVVLAEHLRPRDKDAPPALLIDIAVPRNVEPAVDALQGYTVLDLDAVHSSQEAAGRRRSADLPVAEAICEELLGEFVAWFFHQQALQPVIHAIRDTFEGIRVRELERHMHRFNDVDRAELDRLTQSIIQKLLAVPVVRLKSVEPESIDFVHGIRLLHALFSRPDCEEEGEGPEAAPRAPRPALLRQPSSDAEAACPFEPETRTFDEPTTLADVLRRAGPAGPPERT